MTPVASERAVWTVTDGRNGERKERLLANNLVGGGWQELPSLEGITTRESWLNASPLPTLVLYAVRQRPTSVSCGELPTRMQARSRVGLPLKRTGAIAIGRTTGPYQYRDDRGVDLTRLVQRNGFPRMSLGTSSIRASRTPSEPLLRSAEPSGRALGPGISPRRPTGPRPRRYIGSVGRQSTLSADSLGYLSA